MTKNSNKATRWGIYAEGTFLFMNDIRLYKCSFWEKSHKST